MYWLANFAAPDARGERRGDELLLQGVATWNVRNTSFRPFVQGQSVYTMGTALGWQQIRYGVCGRAGFQPGLCFCFAIFI